jgi:hypothetical protein
VKVVTDAPPSSMTVTVMLDESMFLLLRVKEVVVEL